jgi:rhodanese-related sulfurtransferase
VKALGPTDLEILLRRDPVVVDVRTLEQPDQERFPNALRIPIHDLQNGFHSLPTDRPLLLVCERGLISELAGLYLEAQGYTEVYHLEGGLRKLGKRAEP